MLVLKAGQWQSCRGPDGSIGGGGGSYAKKAPAMAVAFLL